MQALAQRDSLLKSLPRSQRQDLLDFIALSSRRTEDPTEILEILSASIALKYIRVRRN